MPTFKYQGARNGQPVSGTVQAATSWEAETQLLGQQVLVESLREHDQSQRISAREILAFTQSMAGLMESGFSVMDSGEFWMEQARHPQVWSAMFQRVQQGDSLWEVLEDSPSVPKLVCAMVRMGESTGDLAGGFRQSAHFLEARMDMIQNIRSALSYPALVMTVSMGAISVLVFYVLPIFEEMYKRFGHDLPWLTRNLLGLLHHGRQFGFLYGLLLALFLVTYIWARKQPGFRLKHDAGLFRAPLVGPAYRQTIQNVFCQGMASLLKAGIGILESLELASNLVQNRHFQKQVHLARSEISTGKPPAEVFVELGLLQPGLARMLRIGEESGQLSQAFLEIHHYLDFRTRSRLKTMEGFMEPILIVSLAAVIGVILVALYMPMFDLVQILDE